MGKLDPNAPRTYDEALAALPAAWPTPLRQANADRFPSDRKVLVLDDDPTGTQTVHDLWVLTRWTDDELRTAFTADAPAVTYVLTNSRSLPAAEAAALNRTIAERACRLAREMGVDVTLISRGDSTLRGHYPAETDALRAGLASAGVPDVDGLLLCPFFEAGGRLTIDDVHYVVQDDRLVPAAETPFAQDATFGYQASNLKAWVAEKTGGRIAASAVASIPLQLIRQQGPAGVRQVLDDVKAGQVVVVNAVAGGDLDVVVAGLRDVEADGRRFLFRTAASFVKHYAGLPDRALLPADALRHAEGTGGLVVVGSYVPRSSRQLEHLLRVPGVAAVEASVAGVLDDTTRAATIDAVVATVERVLADGRVAAVYTSRTLATAHGRAGELGVAQRVSSALCEVVRRISRPPGFLIAKGGITSSDVATAGLGVQRAWVLGQALPGCH